MATILIVDENPETRQFFAEELVCQGHTVIAVGNDELASEVLRFSRMDLIILDLYMQGEHRWDLLWEIKQPDPSLPILLLTELDHYRKNPRLSLADGILLKNLDSAPLLQKVAQLLPKIQVPPMQAGSQRRGTFPLGIEGCTPH